jgi:hypothetical protein
LRVNGSYRGRSKEIFLNGVRVDSLRFQKFDGVCIPIASPVISRLLEQFWRAIEQQ